MTGLNDLIGVSPTGLGPIMTAMNSQRAADTADQGALAQMFETQQRGQALQQKLMEDRLTQDTRVAAANATNRGKVGDETMATWNRLGQMSSQLGQAIGQLPLETRQAALQKIGQQIPGLADQPVFQGLLNINPEMLPSALMNLGNQIATGQADFIRGSALQGQKDQAAMDRTRLSEAGANARNASSNDAAMERLLATQKGNKELEQLRIDAGKYNKKDIMADPSQAILKYGPEKLAAMAVYEASRADTPEEKNYWNSLGKEAMTLGTQFRSAGAFAKPVIDPNSPTGIGMQAPYGQQFGAPFGSQSQVPEAGSVPKGLPQGTVNNGDGTFTLPDGRRVRAKK